MTEVEWNSCTDPQNMLEWLRLSGKASERKLLLFGVACCRTVWPAKPPQPTRLEVTQQPPIPPRMAELFADRERRDRAAVEAAERFADAEIDAPDFKAAIRAAAHNPAGLLARRGPFRMASEVARSAANAVPIDIKGGGGHGRSVEELPCRMLRDIFGPLPFRSVTVGPSLLIWNDKLVPRLAQAIYDERAFDRLPVLADALEEAGCNNEEILSHCRQEEIHVRGCWVIDLVRSVD